MSPKEMRKLYREADAAKVGETIKCPCCGAELVKRSYQHKFVNRRHKDDYWNRADTNRRRKAVARIRNHRREQDLNEPNFSFQGWDDHKDEN